jgi:hypothetical protein
MNSIQSFRRSGPRYPALRIIGSLSTLLGTVLLAIGAVLLVYAVHAVATVGIPPHPHDPGPLPQPRPQVIGLLPPLDVGLAFFWSLGILFSGLQLIAWGAFLRLMIHLEENTRVSAQVLDQIRSRLAAGREDASLFSS